MVARTLFIASTLCVLLGNVAFGGDKAKMIVKAVGEDGSPLAGITVDARFSGGTERKGLTDTNGLFVLDGVADVWTATYYLQKVGYYDSEGKYEFTSNKYGKWLPWNPVVTVVVRRTINPIPMYAKRMESEIPVLDQFVGYDLEKGDWIAPYGKGVNSDFNFRMRKRYVSIRNFDSSLELILTNAVDGLDEVALSSTPDSTYRLPRLAPLDGYVQHFAISESSTNYFRPNEDQSFLFRVRSITNCDGKIVSAQYGKIRGWIGFDVRRNPTGVVIFNYYLNPTLNDRNMEFDPRKNLFEGVVPQHQLPSIP